MKQILLLSGITLLIGCFGCGPRLAQTPLGPEEQKWEKFIKKNYPEWQAPQTIPPGSGETEKAPEAPGVGPVMTEESVNFETLQVKNGDGKLLASAEAAIITENKFDQYTVQKNDTLWKIAQKFYKNGSKWRQIKDANQDVLKGSDRLVPGMTLKIPLP